MKIDLGCGPRARWYKADEPDWLRLDMEPYEGVTPWVCPEDRIPVPDRSIEEAFVGQLLIYLSLDDQRLLARELNRVMRKDGIIQIEKFSVDTEGCINTLRELGWTIASVELIDTRPGELYRFVLVFSKGGDESGEENSNA